MKLENDMVALEVNAEKEDAIILLIVHNKKTKETSTLFGGPVIELQAALARLAEKMVDAFVENGISEVEAMKLIDNSFDTMKIVRLMDKLNKKAEAATNEND